MFPPHPFFRVLIAGILLLIGTSSFATQARSGTIRYECVGPDQFLITLELMEDCIGFPLPGMFRTLWFSPSSNACNNGIPFSVTLPWISTTENSQLCTTNLPNSACVGGTFPGTQILIFQGVVDLGDPNLTSTPHCSPWIITWSELERDLTNVNIQVAPGGEDVVFRSEMDNGAFACNNSVIFAAPPSPTVCSGMDFSYDPGAYDPDGDSLVFSLVTSLKEGSITGTPFTYSAPYTAQSPMNGAQIDSRTGAFSYKPSTQGNYVVAIAADEYENGTWKGRTIYDFVVNVTNCAQTSPSLPGNISNLTGTATQLDTVSLEVCQGGSFCFDVVLSDPDTGDFLSVLTNVQEVFPGATFSVSGTNPVTASLCVNNTNAVTPGTKGFFIAGRDNGCPQELFRFKTFMVNVTPRTSTNPDLTLCLGDSMQLTANGGSSFSWSVLSGPPMVVGTNFSCNNCPNPVATPTATTTYAVTSNLAAPCINADTVTITVDTFSVVYGNITASGGGPVANSPVFLIEYFGANDSVAALDTVFTDASGNYSFLTVKDTVYVKVAPDSASYPNELPTYYQNGPVFTSGTPVLVPNCDSVTLNFSSLNGLNPGGPGFIAGIVSQGAGKSGVGAPVARLDLVLFNANGDAVQHRQTDANGYFRFENLAQETFTIWTDLPRINNALAPEVAATTDSQDTLRFELNDSTLVQLLSVSVTDPTGAEQVFEAFPNPFHEDAFIRFSLPEGQRIELELLNLLGQPVRQLHAGYRSAGTHEIPISMPDLDLPSGVWLVRLRTATHQQVLRLVHH